MAMAPLGFIFRVPALMRSGMACYFVLLAAEFATWWIPYFFGASLKWIAIYSRIQGRTIRPLPRRGNNPEPNLEHLILMALTALAAVLTLMAYRSVLGASFQNWWIALVVGMAVVGGIVFQFSIAGRKK
jgi:hypothetical protein